MTQISDKMRKVEQVADLMAEQAIKGELNTLKDNRQQISLVLDSVTEEKADVLKSIDEAISIVSSLSYRNKKEAIYRKHYEKLDEKFIDRILEDLEFDKAFASIQFQLESDLLGLFKTMTSDSSVDK